MKYVVCVPDGCADLPVPELDNKTPLEVANTPVLDELAKRGRLGRAQVIPQGMPPGSDVGNMSIFGYDPNLYHTGRAPIEAVAMGLKLNADQVAFRCNLVTVGEDGKTMLDFAGGHPDTSEATKVIDALNEQLGNEEIIFHAGIQYRHIMVAPKEFLDLECTPPHDISNKGLVLPQGAKAKELIEIMENSREVLAGFTDLSANQIWLWGQGLTPQMPSFESIYKKKAGLVTAVDLVRGLGVLTEMEIVEVEGATAWYDTNYEGKRDAVLQGLDNGADLFIIHIEATDEAGHEGNVSEKVKSLEALDSRVLKDLIEGLDEMGDWSMLILPDHATPLILKTHTSDPVPYLLVTSKDMNGKENNKDKGKDLGEPRYTENFVATAPIVEGNLLMAELLAS